MAIKIKRIYDDYAKSDGHRVLVDRVWPRGLKKEDARLDDWLKDVAPSTELRKWFNHDPEKFHEFKLRYKKEISGSDSLQELQQMVKDNTTVTLIYSAKDEDHNQAVALQEMLR